MGRIRCVLVSLLLLSTVYGATYPISPRLDSLKIRTCWNLNIPTTGTDLLTSAKIADAVNRAIMMTCKDYPAIPILDTVYIDSSMEGGVLPDNFDRVSQCFIIYGDTTRIPMIPITVDSLLKLFSNSVANNTMIADANESPVYFVINDSLFSVHPKWRSGTDSLMIRIDYYAIDSLLTADTSITSVQPEYREMIINAACAILDKMRGRDAVYWWKLYGK